MDKQKQVFPALYSQPVVEKLNLPSRAELLPGIESGEVEHLDFQAQVFGTGKMKNPFQFRAEDLQSFANSFEGKPYLRNHDSYNIDSRDGTILSSKLENGVIVQDIRLTTRRGMVDYLEGKMDRFSVGWDYQDAICTICNSSYFDSSCSHQPGRMYKAMNGSKKCELLFIEPSGIETSAVNVPAVENTGIVSALEYKNEIISLAELQVVDELAVGQASAAGETEIQNLALAQARRNRQLVLAELSTLPNLGAIMNYRELLAKRAECLASAKALASLSDTENRDFSEAEREQFAAMLSEAESLGKQINVIVDERARLSAAEDVAKLQPSEAIKPDAAPAAKLIKRGAFEALTHSDRLAFVLSGGSIED